LSDSRIFEQWIDLMPYLTPAELIAYIRSLEGIDQSNEESDQFVIDQPFYERAIESGGNEMDSRLGAYFALPLPASSHTKTLCYPLAHWWAEKQGSKREYVQVEYDRAIALINEIVKGEAVLLNVDGKPVPRVGGDTDPGIDGVQSVGVFVGQRTTAWVP
jgi:phage gp36-like protein